MSQADLSFAIAVPIGSWHPLLPAALRSLSKQGPRLEIAILNASGDPRVDQALDECGLSFAYRRDGPDAGQSAAIMEGWKNTQSDIVGWLNADDMLLANALDEAAHVLASRKEVSGVFAGSIIVNSDRAISGIFSLATTLTDQVSRSNPISQPSCLVRRSAVEAVGGINEDLHYVMDWDLWVRLLEANQPLEPVDALWSAVFWGEGTKTSSLNRQRASEIFELTRQRAGTINALKTLLSVRLDGYRPAFLPLRSATAEHTEERSGVLMTAAHHPDEVPQLAASIRILNAFDSPRSKLLVSLSNEEAEVKANEANAKVISPGCWLLGFNREIEPGKDVLIKLDTAQNATVRFLRAQWQA